MRCQFCATGKEGFTRNLTPGEMVCQILVCQHEMDMRVSNVVAMGQGEPFLNYDNFIDALHIINAPDGLGIGARHISVSTCGVLKGIHAFAEEPEQFTLAISLHSALQSTRDALMPGCCGVSLMELKRELEYYQGKTGRRISFEYLMIDGITDTDESSAALVSFCEGLSAHINLLKINHVDGSPFEPSPLSVQNRFQRTLEKAHIEVSIRDSRGSDIDGACGQLKNSKARMS
jgi:23S rRNA (adenine2503-C2)-methyltransferase